jgi:hypothetical protein
MLCVHLYVLRAHKVVWRKKNDFICGLCKKEKCDTKISLFVAHFFVLSTANKNICFHKTMREHIEYGDIHANIFFPNFLYLKICFLGKESICIWDQMCICSFLQYSFRSLMVESIFLSSITSGLKFSAVAWFMEKSCNVRQTCVIGNVTPWPRSKTYLKN